MPAHSIPTEWRSDEHALVDEIVTSFESLGFQHRAAMAVCSDRQCRDMQFAQCWQKVYADAEHDATLLRSPAVQEKIVRRLLRWAD